MFKLILSFKKFVVPLSIFAFLTVTMVSAQEAGVEATSNESSQQMNTQSSVLDQSSSIITIAEMDAAQDVNGGTWFIVGCLLGLVGWLIAYVVQPNPPATRLIGKSADYVAVYTDAYRAAAKKLQSKKALTGCVVGTLVTVVLQIIIISASANAANQ